MSRPSHSIDELRKIVSRLPTTRNEDWKYTDLSLARDISDRWLAAGGEAPVADIENEIDVITGGIDAHWIVIANGKLADGGSITGSTPAARRTSANPYRNNGSRSWMR